MQSRVSYRYASALLGLSLQNGILELVRKDMQQLQSVLNQSPELARFLKNPIINHSKKATVLQTIFQPILSKQVMDFILLLVGKSRENELPNIVASFEELYNKHAGIVPVRIVSAVELDQQQREQILKKIAHLTGQKVVPSYILDPSLIGGFTVRIGDTVLDASVKTQLDRLQESLSHGVRRN